MARDTNNPEKYCTQVQRLLAKDPAGGKNQSFFQKAKNLIGNTLGQAAFNKITDGVPRIAVKNNTNAALRRLADEVNSGNVSFAGRTINQVSRTVFSTVGINPNVVPSDPNGKTIYDRGKGAAEYVGGLLIAGAIGELDLPGPANDLAALAFWQMNYGELPNDITDPGCGISAYAIDLIPYAPKFNFMFMVEFIFQPDYADMGLQETSQLDRNESIKFKYLCRSFTRPTVRTEHEEVNMYNLRTQIPKKVIYEPVTLKLLDDNKNSSMVFLEKYLKAFSPVARVHPQRQDLMEIQGMDYSPYVNTQNKTGNIISNNLLTNSSASMGGLVRENRTILRKVEVYHMFNYGMRANKYSFLNPKITQFDISDFDMDQGTEIASIDIQMVYDSMFIETDIDMSFDIEDLSKLGKRHLRSKGPKP